MGHKKRISTEEALLLGWRMGTENLGRPLTDEEKAKMAADFMEAVIHGEIDSETIYTQPN